MTSLQHKLLEKCELLIRRREAYLGKLKKLSAERLQQRPAPDRWTLLQLSEHLMLAEFNVAKAIESPETLKHRERKFQHRIRFMIVFLVLRFGLRVKVPSDNLVPQGDLSLEEIEQRWKEAGDTIQNYINQSSDEELQKNYFYHPPSGPLPLSLFLSLGIWHFDSHMRKIDIG